MANSERMILILNEQFVPPKEFTERRLSFADPAGTTENDRDTLVVIEGIPGKGYYGEVEVYYNRLNLEDYVTSFTFRSELALTQALVVEALTRQYGLQIDPDDFEDFTIPALSEGQTYDTTITIKPTSLQWTGSLPIHLEYGKSWLDAMVGKTTLDVMKHPNPNTNKVYARMATWGIDFSGIQKAIKPTASGDYSDWSTLSALALELGIPAWNKNKVVDKPTSQVPDANPLYQRVVIQNTVTSAALQGPVYLHYNPY